MASSAYIGRVNTTVPQAFRYSHSERWRAGAVGLGLLLICTALGHVAATGATFRIALTFCVAVLVLGVWAARPLALLPLLVVWTVGLGMLRRIVTYKVVGEPTGTDPLLLIQPMMLMLLALTAVKSGAFKQRTPLSKAVGLLCVLIVLGSLNPLQGSVFAGLAALLFFVPVAGFWVGGTMIDDRTLRRLLSLVALLALPAVLYGFIQLWSKFPSWDEAWIVGKGYAALNVGGVIRQFSSFSSAAEYDYFLAIGLVAWLALKPGRASRVLSLICSAVLLVGIFYESSRSVIFLLVGAGALTVGARCKLPLRVAFVTLIACVLLLPSAVSAVFPQRASSGTGGTAALVSHQVSGLADPTGSQSTLTLHYSIFLNGLKTAFSQPLGVGISAVNIAGAKFNGASQATEADPSNAAVALGLPGLLLYIIIAWNALAGAYRLAVRRGDPLALAALGVLCVTFLQWMNGGQYAVSYLPWLVLGWLDHRLQGSAGDESPAVSDAIERAPAVSVSETGEPYGCPA